jgi:enoyl-[acyl-carrier protein] reductase I
VNGEKDKFIAAPPSNNVNVLPLGCCKKSNIMLIYKAHILKYKKYYYKCLVTPKNHSAGKTSTLTFLVVTSILYGFYIYFVGNAIMNYQMNNQINVLSESILSGKKGLITGVANNMSIAWHVAKMANECGAEIAITYQGDILDSRVQPLAEEINVQHLYKCDVKDESSIAKVFSDVENDIGKLDFILHAIAFADKNELRGKYVSTSLDNFLNTMHISCYSLTSMCRHASHIMNDSSSILTLTYYGSERVVPGYNVMGVAKAALEASVKYLAYDFGDRQIRVNALSAGPIRTLAASGIGDFRSMLKTHESVSPLRRNVSHDDVAKSAVYLLSPMSSGVTGEVHYVDCGYNIMGFQQ